MRKRTIQKRNAYLVIGGMGIFFGTVYLGLSFQLPFGKIDQPGAGVFPVIVGVIIVIASLATMWEGWQLPKDIQIELPAYADRNRVLGLIGLLFCYFIILSWLGYIISTMLFCIPLMRMLSNLGWPRIVAYSLVMTFMLHVVFVFILKVPMPRGVFGF